MKASICLLLGVAVFSTLFLESSTASIGDLLGSVVGGVGDLTGKLPEVVKKLLLPLLSRVTATVDEILNILTIVLNEAGTLLTNTTGETKDIVTEVQTILNNALDTVAKIPSAIATGTAESLDRASALVGTADELIKQFVDILAANPEVASSLSNVDGLVNFVMALLDSLPKEIAQAKVQISV